MLHIIAAAGASAEPWSPPDRPRVGIRPNAETKIGFDENAHAQEPQAGPCADGRRGILSQIPARPV